MFKKQEAIKISNLLKLSKNQQDFLVERARSGKRSERDFAKNFLVKECRPVVEAIAKKYKDEDVSLEKLIKLGNKGLGNAIQKYPTSKRFRFIVYATWFIRAEIHEFLGFPVDPEVN